MIDEKKLISHIEKQYRLWGEKYDAMQILGDIEDFSKVELKVGTIVECQKHPKADRLLVEQIDLGDEVRQVVSGIAGTYKPEDLIGKQVVVVTNLAPAKIRGVESNGMILCASQKDELSILSPLAEMPKGSKVS